MRRRKRWNPALVLFALLLFMWGGPIWAQGGPVVLMNIDAEEQNNATYNFHGGKGPYTTVLIRSNPETKDIPILATTVLFRKSELNECIEAGCNDYIVKPFTHKQLASRIENLLM